jgi:hypothetical protein
MTQTEASRSLPQDPMSMYEIIFGSCGGVMEAASCFVTRRGKSSREGRARTQNGTRTKSTPAYGRTTSNSGGVDGEPYQLLAKSKSAQGEARRPLKRSKEVVEIPEYLGPEFMDGNASKVACDEISALSAMTLEEMATSPRSVVPSVQKRRKVKQVYPYSSSLLPSATVTVGSSTDDDDKYDDIAESHSRYLMEPPCLIKKIRSNATHDSAYFSYPFTVDSAYYIPKPTPDGTRSESPPGYSSNDVKNIFRAPNGGKAVATVIPKQAAWI